MNIVDSAAIHEAAHDELKVVHAQLGGRSLKDLCYARVTPGISTFDQRITGKSFAALLSSAEILSRLAQRAS